MKKIKCLPALFSLKIILWEKPSEKKLNPLYTYARESSIEN